MLWTFRISVLLFLAWAIFLVSPFVALYDLTKAVAARDLSRIDERVNFPALRTSISRQIVGDYLHTPEGRARLGELDGRAATQAGAAALNPIVEQFVTPAALVDLLAGAVPGQTASSGGAFAVPVTMELGSPRDLAILFFASESNGFRSVVIPFPPGEATERQFRITMRLSSTTWRLTGLDLPRALREKLIARVREKG